jgi:hypothetical protein
LLTQVFKGIWAQLPLVALVSAVSLEKNVLWGDHMKCTKTGRALCIAAVATALACCASNPAPNEKIAVAKFSVQRAEQAGAPESAPVEMGTARDELARAEKAAADRDAVSAIRLAEKANVDAQLAEATAQGRQSAKAAAEFEASLQALRQESLRSSQPNP